MSRRISAVLVSVIVIVLGAARWYLPTFSTPLPNFGTAPQFELFTSEGKVFRAPADFRGRVTVLNLFFTSCQGPCPALMSELAGVARAFRERVHPPDELLPRREEPERPIQFVSITIDPERDTGEVLHRYREKIGIDGFSNWSLLTGSPDEIRRIAEEGFQLGVDTAALVHSSRVVVIDGDGDVRGSFLITSAASGADSDPASVGPTHGDLESALVKLQTEGSSTFRR